MSIDSTDGMDEYEKEEAVMAIGHIPITFLALVF